MSTSTDTTHTTQLRELLGTALVATTDALDDVSQPSTTLPALTTRSIKRLLANVHAQLRDAHRMADPQAVAAARLVESITHAEGYDAEDPEP